MPRVTGPRPAEGFGAATVLAWAAVLLLGGLRVELSLVPQRLGILCPAAPLGKPRGQPLDLQVKRCAAGQSMT
ncbi:hypothetical protein OJ963_40425 [Streptomyces sp. RS2]|uniref:hypothetical protein n=1 Tax=Streptomyces sp. RS2 TaxID=1451205 RepID=UPI0021F8EE78|nr:hypothetical protein [Streptomyces sp. RS2]MCW1100059.1 hypothetical protein [Streptomyces sp. RS2]